mgnify:CR=1 FL=1
MNHKSNWKVFAWKFLHYIIMIFGTIWIYQPISDYLRRVLNITKSSAGYCTTLILALISAFIGTLLKTILNSGSIATVNINWFDNKNSPDLSYQKNVHPSADNGQPLKRVRVKMVCIPKRTILFSLMHSIGMGIVIYNSVNAFGFTKSGVDIENGYSVMNEKKVFVKDFYWARKGDKGLTRKVSFDLQIIDTSVEECYLYCGLAFGTPKHKKNCSHKMIKLNCKPLKITVSGGK